MTTKQRPTTTLFMLMSLDGKISTGNSDELDFDKNLPMIDGVKEGLHQYYELEKTTDTFSFNTGRVMAKIGVNDHRDTPTRIPVTFVIVDNRPHLTKEGVQYLSDWTKKLIIVTTNQSHPALKMDVDNLEVVVYQGVVDFISLFRKLKSTHGADRLTIQSGGEMNSELIRAGLVDNISLVIAPAIVGGRDTSTLVDGASLLKESDLGMIKTLELINVEKLNNSYLHLRYKVIN